MSGSAKAGTIAERHACELRVLPEFAGARSSEARFRRIFFSLTKTYMDVGGGHDGIELELANRRVNSVDARIAINGERLVIGKPTEDGLRVIGSRLKCIGKVKDVLIEEGHLGAGVGVIEINRRLECPASYRHAKARPENYANCPAKWLWVDLISTGCAPVS